VKSAAVIPFGAQQISARGSTKNYRTNSAISGNKKGSGLSSRQGSGKKFEQETIMESLKRKIAIGNKRVVK